MKPINLFTWWTCMVTMVSYLIRWSFDKSVSVNSMNSFKRSKNCWLVFRIISLSTLLFLIANSASFVHKICTPMRPAWHSQTLKIFISYFSLSTTTNLTTIFLKIFYEYEFRVRQFGCNFCQYHLNRVLHFFQKSSEPYFDTICTIDNSFQFNLRWKESDKTEVE